MKRFNISTIVLALVLIITAVGCTTMGETRDGYYSRRVPGRRVYVERDPYAGRYYDVDPYGYGYYGRPYGGRVYGGGYYGGYSRGGRGYYNREPRRYQETPQTNKQRETNRDASRRKVLGN